MKKMNAVFLLPLLLLGCRNRQIEKIDELKAKIEAVSQEIESLSKEIEKSNSSLSESINRNIENQTSVFYRTLGESLPVFIPAETEESIKSINASAEECIKNPSAENYSKAEGEYIRFVTATPPWIQEELFSEIKKARLNLEYARILSEHKNDSDYFDSFIGDLNLFIISAKEYPKIEEVKSMQKNLISGKHEKIRNEVAGFVSKIAEVSKNYSLDEEKYKDFMKQFDDYEIFLQNNGKTEFIPAVQKLKTDLTNAKTVHDDKNEYDRYLGDFNDFVAQVKNSEYSASKYVELREILPVIVSKHPERKNDGEVLLEWTIFSDVRKDLKELDESLKKEQAVTHEFLDEKETALRQLENQISSIKSNSIDASGLKKTASELNKTVAGKRNLLIHSEELEKDALVLADSEQKIDKVLKELSNYSENISTATEKILAKIESDITGIEKALDGIKNKKEVDSKDVKNKIADSRKLLKTCREKLLSKKETPAASQNPVSKVQGIYGMVKIPGTDYMMGQTEVTQKLYEKVMGENPSPFKGDGLPVENVSWYDAICFCNRLSEMEGLEPVYAVDGKTDVARWNYRPNQGNSISRKIEQSTSAGGYRLPTELEWEYGAKGGENHTYSGSDSLDEVGWYSENSERKTHEVAQKKANGYGLYDMSGNVREWCWDAGSKGFYNRGGDYTYSDNFNTVSSRKQDYAYLRSYGIGFRIVRSADK